MANFCCYIVSIKKINFKVVYITVEMHFKEILLYVLCYSSLGPLIII